MKIIDLLNRIANGEEVPKKIKLSNGGIFNLDEDNAYYCYDINCSSDWLSNEYIFGHNDLNEEIEILEEEKKIPEKLEIIEDCGDTGINDEYMPYKQFRIVSKKINEIIDVLEMLNGKIK